MNIRQYPVVLQEDEEGKGKFCPLDVQVHLDYLRKTPRKTLKGPKSAELLKGTQEETPEFLKHLLAIRHALYGQHIRTLLARVCPEDDILSLRTHHAEIYGKGRDSAIKSSFDERADIALKRLSRIVLALQQQPAGIYLLDVQRRSGLDATWMKIMISLPLFLGEALIFRQLQPTTFKEKWTFPIGCSQEADGKDPSFNLFTPWILTWTYYRY